MISIRELKKREKQRTRTCHALRWPSPTSKNDVVAHIEDYHEDDREALLAEIEAESARRNPGKFTKRGDIVAKNRDHARYLIRC